MASLASACSLRHPICRLAQSGRAPTETAPEFRHLECVASDRSRHAIIQIWKLRVIPKSSELIRSVKRSAHLAIYRAYGVVSRRIQSRPIASDYSLAVPFPFEPVIPNERIASVCHIFNTDLIPEIKSYLLNLTSKTDLYITTDSQAKASEIVEHCSDWPHGKLEVRVVSNRGRDIAPKYVGCRDVLENYDLVVFTHSKKSSTFSAGDDWRHWLFRSTCGSRKITESILTVFASDEKVGIVFPQNYPPIRHLMAWGGMFSFAAAVARRMDINLQRISKLDFPAGSFFWARTAALKPILDLNLSEKDFPDEAGQTNGTVAHVLERLVLHSCERAGYSWIKVLSEDYPDAPQTVAVARSLDDLKAFLARRTFSLLRTNK